MMFEFRWPSAEFERLKDAWVETPRATARIEFDVPAGVDATCPLYEVWSVESAQSLSDADDTYIREQERNGPILEGAEAGVRYFPRLCISKVKPKPNRILSLDAEVPVHIITRGCAEEWVNQQFSGLDFGEVSNRKLKKFEDVALIVPQCVLGPMCRGENVVRTEDGGLTRDQVIGFCVYSSEELARACDFNFSREPLYTFGYPKVLVSRRFVDMYRAQRYRGWRLRPVLEKDSVSEKQFTAALHAFLADWSSGCAANRIVGP
jgi:hypothetical protein